MKCKVLSLFLVLIYHSVLAQYVPKDEPDMKTPKEKPTSGFNKESLYYGGWIGAQFGLIRYINFSPLVGYRFSDRLSAGTGLTYMNYSDRRFVPTFTTSMVGGRVFGRFHFSDQIFFHGEYESLLSKLLDNNGTQLDSRWRSAALAGIGYMMNLGSRPNRGGFLLLLWDLTYSPGQSIYPSPLVVRGGIQF